MVRVQPPADPKSGRVILMLHGWTGDENVMSVFGASIPADYWLISPRGPVKAVPSGFGWLSGEPQKYADYSEYTAVTDVLDRQVEHWLQFLKISSQDD